MHALSSGGVEHSLQSSLKGILKLLDPFFRFLFLRIRDSDISKIATQESLVLIPPPQKYQFELSAQ